MIGLVVLFLLLGMSGSLYIVNVSLSLSIGTNKQYQRRVVLVVGR